MKNRKLLVFAIVFFPLVGLAQQQQPMPANKYQTPREYLNELNYSLEEYQKGKITALEFERIFFPTGTMQFFLSYNYNHPEVAELLHRIEKARVSEAIASNISAYISGQQKQRDIYMRKTHPELAQPVPLLVGGFAPPDPEPSLTPDPMSASIWLNDQKSEAVNPQLSPNQESSPSLGTQ